MIWIYLQMFWRYLHMIWKSSIQLKISLIRLKISSNIWRRLKKLNSFEDIFNAFEDIFKSSNNWIYIKTAFHIFSQKFYGRPRLIWSKFGFIALSLLASCIIKASHFYLLLYFVWLSITDQGSIPEMHIWYFLLIQFDLKIVYPS